MDLLTLLIAVIVIAVVFWLLTHYVSPLVPAPWGNVIVAVFALLVIIWLLSLVGILPALSGVRVGR